MTKRIIISTSTYPRWPGDTTTPFVAQFASRLSERGWEVFVLAPHAKGAKTAERVGAVQVRRYRYFWPSSGETLAYDGGAVTKIKKSPGYLFKLVLLLKLQLLYTWWLVVRYRPSVINAHWMIPQGFLSVIVGRVMGKKVVVTVHGGDVFSLNSSFMRRFKIFTLKHADAVVVNSSATLAACRQLVSRPDYHVIPVGVDMERFTPKPPSKRLRQQYSLGQFTILYVGRLVEQKGVWYLLDALRRLQITGADFKALIIGEGPEKASLEEFVRINGLGDRVVFIGWIDAGELRDYYNVADVFVGPSIVSEGGQTEALGVVFIEAVACGLPVIATQTGGIADVVEDGVTGVLVPQRSSEAILRQLEAFYTHPDRLHALSINGHTSMQAKFSWDSVIKRYEKIIEP